MVRPFLRAALRRLRRRPAAAYHDVWNAFRTDAEARRAIYNETDESVFEEGGRLDAALVRQFLPPDAEVVDIGCGIGRVEAFLAPHCRRLTGVDISERMLHVARARLAHLDNLRWLRNNGRDLAGVEDASIDLAFSFFVLQHLEKEDAFRYLREVRRVLKPDGRFLLQFPLLASGYFGESFLADVAAGPPYPVARPRLTTPPESVFLLLQAGLTPRRLIRRGRESILVGDPLPPDRAAFFVAAGMLDRMTSEHLYSSFVPSPPAGGPARDLLPALAAHPAARRQDPGTVAVDAAGEAVIVLTPEAWADGVLWIELEGDDAPARRPPDLSLGVRARPAPGGWAGPYVQTDSGHAWTLRRREGTDWDDLPAAVHRSLAPRPEPVRLGLVADGPWLSLYDDRGCLCTAAIDDPAGVAYLRLVDTRVRIRTLSVVPLSPGYPSVPTARTAATWPGSRSSTRSISSSTL